jgi:hypothetical protein
MMQRALLIIAICFVSVFPVTAQDGNTAPRNVQHLATALDHITVLEFGEPVTQAAAGSSAFNIEWRQNKVLIKPTKPGASTDLFVWTASRRFAYELDPPGEANNMNYAVDNPVIAKPAPSTDLQMKEVADMVLTRALLGADRIDSTSVKDHKGSVVVRIENVFQSANGVYIRYSIVNRTEESYHAGKPAVAQVLPVRTRVSLVSFGKTQLGTEMLHTLRDANRNALTVATSEASKEDLGPNESSRGVIVLRQQLTTPMVLEFTFADAGNRHVTAAFVF